MERTSPRIYLSATTKDLGKHCAAIASALQGAGYQIKVPREDMPPAERRKHLAESDLCLILVAWHLGDRQPNVVETDEAAARGLGVACLVFLLHEDAPWPRSYMDQGAAGQDVEALRRSLARRYPIHFFEDTDALVERAVVLVKHALGQHRPSSIHGDYVSGDKITGDKIIYQGLSREERLGNIQARIINHDIFIQSRLAHFVGRKKELKEIREHIATLQPTGGYLTVTAHAGQGKTSIIAKLIHVMGSTHVAHHFIPFNPGPDHQISLLRDLIARLVIKYDLSENYVASESRPTLRDSFVAVLRNIADLGGQEVIFIDGLDQLREDANGTRDLSFLPVNPPAGIVFVLGMRPDDTLTPLERYKPCAQYLLHGLSFTDFETLLTQRALAIKSDVAHRLYAAMASTALYLDLVVQELARGFVQPEDVIARVAADPDNIFSLSLERLIRSESQWERATKPILGILLVAQQPLSIEALQTLIRCDDLTTRRAILRLGGLLTINEHRRYTLYHLKLRDYLRQAPDRPERDYIFSIGEELDWHLHMASWCERGTIDQIWQALPDGDPDNERRAYARQYYAAHLFHGGDRERLFALLDDHAYGRAKVRHDPTTRAYVQDLDLGRQAAIQQEGDAGRFRLPYLWRYSLLRCNLASRVDNAPLSLYTTLAQLGRTEEAIQMAELITDPGRRTTVLLALAKQAGGPIGLELLFRVRELAQSLENPDQRSQTIVDLVAILSQTQQWRLAYQTVRTIEYPERRAMALADLAAALNSHGHTLSAEYICRQAQTDIEHYPDPAVRAITLARIGAALGVGRSLPVGQARRWDELEKIFRLAQQAAGEIDVHRSQIQAEVYAALSGALSVDQRWDAAEEAALAISTPWLRVSALVALANALVPTRYYRQATRVFLVAEQTAAAIRNRWQRTMALTTLASALSEAYISPYMRWSLGRNHHQPKYLMVFISAEESCKTIDDRILQAQAFRALSSALTQAQSWEKAHSIAMDIDDESGKAAALIHIGGALHQAQRFMEAANTLDLAQKMVVVITDPDQRVALLLDLAVTFRQTEHYDQSEHAFDLAWQLIQAQDIPTHQAEAFAAIGLASFRTDQRTMAAAVIDRAQQTAQSIRDPQRRAQSLAYVVGVLAAGQWWEQAITTAAMIDASVEEDASLISLVTTLIHARQWSQARRAIAMLRYEGRQAQMQAMLADALSRAGEWEGAAQTIAEINDSVWVDEARRRLTLALAQDQEWIQALDMTLTIDHPGERDSALATLATALAHARQEDLALQTLSKISSAPQRSAAQARVTLLQANNKQWTQALKTAQAIENLWKREEALAALVASLSAASRWQQAWEVGSAITNPLRQAMALAGLVNHLARAQDWDDALRVAHAIDVVEEREMALVALADSLAQHGQRDQAQAIILALQTPAAADAARSMAGVALAQTGNWAAALTTASMIDAPQAKDSVLAACMIALGHAGVWEQALHTARDLASAATKSATLDTLLGLLIQASAWDWALAVADAIKDPAKQSDALARLGLALYRAGVTDQAVELIDRARLLANELKPPVGQARALITLARVLIEVNRPRQADACVRAARKAALQIPNSTLRTQIFTELIESFDLSSIWTKSELGPVLKRARQRDELLDELLIALSVLVQTHRWADAAKVIEGIDDLEYQDEARCTLADALIQAELWEQARQIAVEIAHLEWKSEILHNLAYVLSQAHRWDEAQHIIRIIGSPQWRSRALGELVASLISEGQKRQDVSLLARAHLLQRQVNNADFQPILSAAQLVTNRSAHVRLVQNLWSRAENREEILALLSLAQALMVELPSLSVKLLEGMDWASAFFDNTADSRA